MKILVPVKRVVDPYVKIRVKPDHLGVETAHQKMAMNPFDAIALEAALQLREQHGGEVILVSIDTQQAILRQGLAMGANSAVLIHHADPLPPLTIAKLLRNIAERKTPDLILMGKQAIDGDHNQTGQMLASLLDWPQATFASEIKFTNQQIQVTREIDGGLETLAFTPPGVITTDLRLNEPRYATLPNIMRAKQKPLEIINIDILKNIHYEILKTEPPPQRTAGEILGSVDELLAKLKGLGLI